jgi:hypothetical protein
MINDLEVQILRCSRIDISFLKKINKRSEQMRDQYSLVIEEILKPVMPLIVEEAQKMPHDAGTYTLSF